MCDGEKAFTKDGNQGFNVFTVCLQAYARWEKTPITYSAPKDTEKSALARAHTQTERLKHFERILLRWKGIGREDQKEKLVLTHYILETWLEYSGEMEKGRTHTQTHERKVERMARKVERTASQAPTILIQIPQLTHFLTFHFISVW